MHNEFDVLVDQSYSDAFRYACVLTHNEFDANLILSKALTKAYKKFDQYSTKNGAGSFSAWLRKIIHNTFVDDYRHKHGKRQIILVSESNLPDGFEPISEIANAENDVGDSFELQKKYINEAFAKLPKKRQQMLELKIHQNLKYKEIADKMGIKIGTVMSNINRATIFIKQYVKEKMTNESV